MSWMCRICLMIPLGLFTAGTQAAQHGPFTYMVQGSAVTIQALAASASGDVEVPASIEGRVVTRIAAGAFRDCAAVTSLAIPAGVFAIGDSAFAGCDSLSGIAVDPGNGIFSVTDGVLFNIDENLLMWYPPQRAGAYDVPQGVTGIAASAFLDRTGLTAVTMPVSVVVIGREAFANTGLVNVAIGGGVETVGEGAFSGCARLGSVVIPAAVEVLGADAFRDCPGLFQVGFTGDAPEVRPLVFGVPAAGFRVAFYNGAWGFTAPAWNGYPSVNMGPATSVKSWLVRNHQPFDAPLESDPDGDGVALLMAYALALDPNADLSPQVPRPVVSPAGLAMDFHSGTAGIIYQVQTSADLRVWSAEGVTVSAPDAGQIRRATFPAAGGARFMRLAVSR